MEAARPVSPWFSALAVMGGTFMVVLDTTVVNVSLPHIAGSLSSTIEESTWALTSYLAANAIILPITGWLAGFFGRKRLLLSAVTGFTAASFMCGLAPSLPVLILWRVVQGATGGVMQPLSQAVMLEAFPPRDRGKAMGFWGVGIVAAPILGPVLGGWLTDNWSWRWVFYVNIPVGVVAVLMIRRFIFDPPYLRRPGRIDAYGIGLLAIGIAALQIGLDKGQEEDWFASRFITALLVVAAAGLALFVRHALVAREPVVDLRVFRERTFAAGSLLITVMGFVLYGSLVMLPVMLQTLLAYPPVRAGIAMMPRGYGTLLAMPVTGVLTGRFDPRKLLGLGLLGGAATLYWFSRLNLEVGYWDLFWPQFFQGVAFGLLFVPLTTVTMDRIERSAMGNATSLFNLLRNIGGAAGIAVVETVLERDRQLHTSVLGAHVDPYGNGARLMLQQMRAAFVAQGADLVTATQRAYAALWGEVQRQAAILAYLDAFRLLALLFLATLPLVLVLRKPRHHGGAEVMAAE